MLCTVNGTPQSCRNGPSLVAAVLLRERRRSLLAVSCALCDMQVPLKRKALHWSKLAPSSVQGSVFHRQESDRVFSMEHLADKFQVSSVFYNTAICGQLQNIRKERAVRYNQTLLKWFMFCFPLVSANM